MSATAAPVGRLVDQFEHGLDAPICLTWELTYACNLACVHCLSSSGRRDPRELSTAECKAVIDELQRMQVFYVNIGGGEPTVRRDFWELLDYATAHDVGVKFSTNGSRITPAIARAAGGDRLRRRPDLARRRHRGGQRPRPRARLLRHGDAGDGRLARRRLRGLQDLGGHHARERRRSSTSSRPSPTARRAVADHAAAARRAAAPTSGTSCIPTASQQRELYDWLLERGEEVLTGDSFFHLAAYGDPLPGLNLCGAGRVVCLIDPVGDVYACPFAIHDAFRAGNVREPGGFSRRLARVGAVPRSAPTADRRRMLLVLALRLVSRRLHGGEVLHRACRSTGPIRSACSGTASRSSPLARRGRAAARRSTTRAGRRPIARATRIRSPDFWRAAAWRAVATGSSRSPRRSGGRSALPKPVYDALVAGAERGTTLDDNVEAFGELGFVPRIAAGLSAERDLATTVMGQAISLPVIISPTGVQAVIPDGEVAVARAAAARGPPWGSSSFASKPVEEVVAANPQTFFQMYWLGTRERIVQRHGPCQGAPARRGSSSRSTGPSRTAATGAVPRSPSSSTCKTMASFAPRRDRAPAVAARVRCAAAALRTSPCPTSRRPAATLRRSSAPTASGCRPRCPAGRTSPGCASSGRARSCSRA